MAYQILTNVVANITDLKRNPMGTYLQGMEQLRLELIGSGTRCLFVSVAAISDIKRKYLFPGQVVNIGNHHQYHGEIGCYHA